MADLPRSIGIPTMIEPGRDVRSTEHGATIVNFLSSFRVIRAFSDIKTGGFSFISEFSG
jgi:hypothetical protein